MTSYSKALNLVLSRIKPFGNSDFEEVNVEASLEKLIAEDVKSELDIPPFDFSRVDGYALNSESITVSEKRYSMKILDKISGNSCVWVNTGDRLPEGADCVLKYEDVLKKDNTIFFTEKPEKWQNVSRKGEDIEKGETVLKKGTKITRTHIVLLRNCGISTLKVLRKPKIAVIPTGDELTGDFNKVRNEEKIPESNGLMVSLFLEKWGCEPLVFDVVADNMEHLERTIGSLEGIDMVVTTGGTSAGKRDLMLDFISNWGRVLFSKSKIYPGKSTIFGLIDKIPIFSLPGSPSACFAGLCLYVKPAVLKMLVEEEKLMKGHISENIPLNSSFTCFVPVYFNTANAEAKPLTNKTGFFRNLIYVNGYLVVNEGMIELKKGDVVFLNLL